jgi:hypothetical protein
MTIKTHSLFRTKANKIRRAEKELKKNPNNVSVIKSLEFWKQNDRKLRTHRSHARQSSEVNSPESR